MPEHTAQDFMALRLATSADFEPDKGLVALAESILAGVKSGDITGVFGIAERGACSRDALMAGTLDADGIAGFAARVLASMANNA